MSDVSSEPLCIRLKCAAHSKAAFTNLYPVVNMQGCDGSTMGHRKVGRI